nr:hypothetical protein L203_04754 [Cryptococcus depauperatus CBS 7841]
MRDIQDPFTTRTGVQLSQRIPPPHATKDPPLMLPDGRQSHHSNERKEDALSSPTYITSRPSCHAAGSKVALAAESRPHSSFVGLLDGYPYQGPCFAVSLRYINRSVTPSSPSPHSSSPNMPMSRSDSLSEQDSQYDIRSEAPEGSARHPSAEPSNPETERDSTFSTGQPDWRATSTIHPGVVHLGFANTAYETLTKSGLITSPAKKVIGGHMEGLKEIAGKKTLSAADCATATGHINSIYEPLNAIQGWNAMEERLVSNVTESLRNALKEFRPALSEPANSVS